ncbi:hypothetical protein MCERE3_00026 [Candidatus Nanopelagicaceae bacterium]
MAKSELVNKLLNKFELQLNKTTPRETLLEFRKMLTPVDNGFELIRAGSESDGGYLVPDDLKGMSKIISGGCDSAWSFEKFFLEQYDVESIIVDRISKKPIDLSPRIEYVDAWFGEGDNFAFVSLASILNGLEKTSEPELLLQLDIEGAEFSEVQRIPEEELKRFRILVIEFHGLDRAINREFHKSVILPVFKKILKDFDLVHSHANNCCGAISIHGVNFPRVLELTFHNKSRREGSLKVRTIPNQLDVPNDPSKADLKWAGKSA